MPLEAQIFTKNRFGMDPTVEEITTAALSLPVFSPGGDQEMKSRRRKRKKKGDGEVMRRNKLSEEQTKFLEMSFRRERRLEAARKERLAVEAGIDPKRVAVWFQNRRARWKNKMMEEEYTKLKAALDSTVISKCQLEAEVLKLREELSEAHREIKKLTSSAEEGMISRSSNASPSFAEISTPLLVELQQGKYEFEYMNDYFGYMNMWDWGS